ncbi:MAG TPA: sigma 54-interacting transcriptional regulator [candidate division Zixibacteria bacterium]|nr:sigma 54-interacting transcriptional regulator [candidate division Zixibacteria bacterium]
MLDDRKTTQTILIACRQNYSNQQLVQTLRGPGRTIVTIESLEEKQKLPVDIVLTDSQELDNIKALQTSGRIVSDLFSETLLLSDDIPDVTHRWQLRPIGFNHEAHDLELIVDQALENIRLNREVIQLRETVAQSYGFDNIVGISKHIEQLKETAARLAPTDIALLIQGGPGTGKKLLAHAIHHHSERRNGPFVSIDLSAVPVRLLKRDLFGIEDDDLPMSGRKSLVEQADGGTLLLEEVSQVPLDMQTVLADFLQDFRLPEGHAEAGRKLDVRVISSTDQVLTSMVRDGEFEQRLLDRLSVIPIKMATLAERSEDIEILTDYFLRRICRDLDRPTLFITREAVDRLLAYSWPGNVRELENCLRRAATLCKDDTLDVRDITFLGVEGPSIEEHYDVMNTRVVDRGKRGLLDTNQRSVIEQALDENDWNFTQTAQELGIGRTTLWRKVKKYKLTRSSSLENV